ncbi:MAG: hypothetical protein DWQ04_01780 [Chloroflexi bacterium]|nr:MAG: hypothetical protein DWQ04_01780 [Chloroflexota bacterium]
MNAQLLNEAETTASPEADATNTPIPRIFATSTPYQPIAELSPTNSPTPTSTPIQPTLEPVLDTTPPTSDLLIEAQSIRIRNNTFNFSIFTNGRVLLANGTEYFVPTDEVELLHSYLILFSASLWSANDLDLIQNASCDDCSRINFYHPADDQFGNFVIGEEIQLSAPVPADTAHEIQTSAVYTYHLIKLFLESVLGLSNEMDHVFTSTFYENGILDEQRSFTIYAGGAVALSTGDGKNAPIDSIPMLEKTLNSYVFSDNKFRNDDLRYETTDCTDCFQITFFDYGEYGPITIEGDTKGENLTQFEALITKHIDDFSQNYLE